MKENNIYNICHLVNKYLFFHHLIDEKEYNENMLSIDFIETHNNDCLTFRGVILNDVLEDLNRVNELYQKRDLLDIIFE